MKNLCALPLLLILCFQTVLLFFHSSYIQPVLGETCFGIASSSSKTCSGRGICTPDNLCTCNVDPSLGSSSPYSGLNCEVDLCFPNAIISYNCNGNGQCENGVCKCKEGTSGFMCHLNSTKLMCFGVSGGDSRVCSGHGKCLDTNVCSCQDGYTGTECQVPLCYGIPSTLTSSVCSGKGTCKGQDTCECQSGFSGANCEVLGSVSSQGSSVAIPVSFCGSIIDSDNRTCNGRGKCIANDTCLCMEGYNDHDMCQSTFCFSIPQYDALVCSGHGNCIDYNTCNCTSSGNSSLNFIGNECEIVQCLGRNFHFYNSTDSNVCNGNGFCSSTNDGCICKDGYYGDACEQFDWSGENCDICDENYSGTNCNETVTCQSETVCHLLGSCFNNTCQCEDHYSGPSCSLCQDGFYGPLCNHSCSRVDTCHGHGECSRDGIFCECDQSNEGGYWDDLSMCQKCKNGYFGSRFIEIR